jgi:hypothetical protein
MRKLMAFWIFSLALVAGLASLVTAQVYRTPPEVISGNDLGFRLEGIDIRTGKPVGRLLIRQKGEWIVVGDPMEGRRLATLR